MMVVPWVLLLVVIVVAAGMICWIKTTKIGTIFNFIFGVIDSIAQSTVNQRRERKEYKVEEKESVMYDEVKAETAISLKSNIAYTTAKHNSVL